MAIVSAEVRFAPQLTAWFTANPTKVLQNGEIVYCSDGANIGKYVIGDNSTELQSLVFYGGISASGLTVGSTTITGGTSTRVLYNNAGVVGEYAISGSGSVLMTSTIGSTVQGYSANTTLLGNSTTGSGSIVLATAPTFVTKITTPLINSAGNLQIDAGAGSHSLYLTSGTAFGYIMNQYTEHEFYVQVPRSSGAFIPYKFGMGTRTNQTTTQNIPNFQVTGSVKQWATGTVANQYWNYLSANTAAFVGASTMTNSYGLYVEAATAGTNATITNNYSFGTNGKAKFGGNIELTQTVTTEAVVSDTTVTIVINGTTYKLLARA